MALFSRPARLRAASLILLMTVAGCRERLAGDGGPFGDRVAHYVPKIEEIVGLKFKRPPKVEVRSVDQVRQFLESRLGEPIVQRELVGQTATYRVLGLIHDTLDLAKFFVPLLREQIIGYYDPKTDVLYVVEGAPEEHVGLTLMHELVHALQAQYVNLDSLQNLTGNDDAQAAIQAVIEGQAVYVSMVISAGPSNVVAMLPSWMNQIRLSIRSEQMAQPVFGSAPMVIQETLLFPYMNGAEFVGRFMVRRPGAQPFDSMPASTEQILHEETFFNDPRVAPLTVTLPPVAGSFYENTMGEFGTRLFVFRQLSRESVSNPDTASLIAAANAAKGWGGDRFATFRSGTGNGIAWVTVWKTALDAADFVSTLDDGMVKWFGFLGIKQGDVRIYRSATREVEVTTRDIGGKTAVLFVNVPSGASTKVLDLARVTVR